MQLEYQLESFCTRHLDHASITRIPFSKRLIDNAFATLSAHAHVNNKNYNTEAYSRINKGRVENSEKSEISGILEIFFQDF